MIGTFTRMVTRPGARATWIGVVVALTVSQATADDPRLIAETCRAGLMQSRAAIRTFQCVMDAESHDTAKPLGGKPQLSRLTWVEAGGVALATQTIDSIRLKYRWDGKRLKWLRSDEGPGYGQLAGSDGINTVETVWAQALFDPESEWWSNEFRPEYIRGATRETVGGASCWRVDLSDGTWRRSYWFDPARNYLVLKSLYSALPANAVINVWTVDGAREHGPGIFFPEVVTTTAQTDDVVRPSRRCKFTGVKVNADLDPATLQFRFPRGAIVTDRQAGVTYTVGDHEEPVGPIVPAAKPRGPDPANIQMPTGVTLPGHEGGRGSRYWIWAVGAAGILAGVVVYRLWRRAGPSGAAGG
jgi:hypothetical protein